MTDMPVRTYEIAFATGELARIDIPENYKITFGPIVGAKGDNERSGYKVMAFRAWEAETKQRLLLTGVESFRDVSLPMTARAVRRFGSKDWFADDGTWVGDRTDLVEKSWQSIDNILRSDPAKQDEPEEADEDGFHAKPSLRGMTPRANRGFTVRER